MVVAQPPEDDPQTLFTSVDGSLPLVLIMARVYPHTMWVRAKGAKAVTPKKVWVVPDHKPSGMVDRVKFADFDSAYAYALNVLFRKLVRYS